MTGPNEYGRSIKETSIVRAVSSDSKPDEKLHFFAFNQGFSGLSGSFSCARWEGGDASPTRIDSGHLFQSWRVRAHFSAHRLWIELTS